MTEDNWRTALAEALEERFSYATQCATVVIDWDEEAEALMPVVRHLAAEELRAAAEDWWKPGRPHRPVRDWLNDRAAALDTPDHGKA